MGGRGITILNSFGGFLGWWGRALAAWIPPRWRRALGMDRGRILLQVREEQLWLFLERDAELHELEHVPLSAARATGMGSVLPLELRELPRWLLLPAPIGLRRHLVLPSAARDRLREIAGFEIDRQTPFASGTVAYDTRLLGRRGSEGQLEVELVVVPQARLAAQLQALGESGTSLAGVDLADRDGAAIGVNLLAPVERRQQRGPMLGWNAALAAIALVAIAWTMAQILDNRRAALAGLQADVDARVRAARQVSLHRRELVDLSEGRAFIEGLARKRTTSLEVMEYLASRLPDDTHLEKLSMDGNRVTLVGLSGAASSLVGRLTGDGPLETPALTGVLQPDPTTGRERFTLVADLAGGTNDARSP